MFMFSVKPNYKDIWLPTLSCGLITGLCILNGSIPSPLCHYAQLLVEFGVSLNQKKMF